MVGQLQHEWARGGLARGLKRDHLVRDRHLDPELLCLIVGACHQGEAGDAGGKAQIVLDPGGSTGLAAERAAVEHQDGEPFRSGIDRGRKAGRPGAHDHHVIEPLGIDRAHQPDAARELVLAGIVQQLSARAQHDRQLAGIDMEAFDQRLCLRIGLRIEPLMRMAVAAQKPLQPQHVAVLGAADDHRPAGPGLEQADPAQDQGAHDPLAELRLRHQQCPQPLRPDDQRLHRPLRVGVHQRRPPRQLGELTGELARAMGDDEFAAARFIMLGDIDLAGKDDDEAIANLADLGQHLARPVGADLAEPTHPLDLRALQRRKHLVASSDDDRLCRYGHGSSRNLLPALERNPRTSVAGLMRESQPAAHPPPDEGLARPAAAARPPLTRRHSLAWRPRRSPR